MSSLTQAQSLATTTLNVLLDKAQGALQNNAHEEALAWLSYASLLSVSQPAVWRKLIETLLLLKRFDEAQTVWDTAQKHLTEDNGLLDLQADIWFRKGELTLALALYQRLQQTQPTHPKVWVHAALCAQQLSERSLARAYLLHATQLDPQGFEAHANLGIFSWRMGYFDESVLHAGVAAQIRPNDSEARRILGDALLQVGRLEEAASELGHALNLNPSNAHAGRDLSHTLLLMGRLNEGWQVAEHRWAGSGNMQRPVFYDPAREWTPQPAAKHNLQGLRLVVYQEQGYGDVIQFSRYIHWLQRDGAVVFFWLNEGLVPLIASLNAVAPQGASPIAFIGPNSSLNFNAHIALMDLPRAYATDVYRKDLTPALNYINLPFSDKPYLSGRPEQVAAWQDKLQPWSSSFKIGLVWCGRPSHDNDPNRSFALSLLEPLFSIAKVQCFSLQKFLEGANNDLAHAKGHLIDFSEEWQDFSDTAALIQNLDLVIAIDSAICHLAGSVGTPTWTLIPPNPDWRWLDKGLGWDERTVWYANMRLLRRSFDQSKESQIAQVVQDVQRLVDAR